MFNPPGNLVKFQSVSPIDLVKSKLPSIDIHISLCGTSSATVHNQEISRTLLKKKNLELELLGDNILERLEYPPNNFAGPSRPAETHLRRKAVRGRPHPCRLQHSEGV